jgi:biotin transporter BioY
MMMPIKILFCFAMLSMAALTQVPLLQIKFTEPYISIYDYSLLYLVCFILSNSFRNNYCAAGVILYLIAGFCGLPIFAFGGGLAYIQEASLGYLVGLLALSIIGFYFRYYVPRFPLMTHDGKSLGPLVALLIAHGLGLIYLLCRAELNLENFLGMTAYQIIYDLFFAWIAILIIPKPKQI